MEEAYLVQPNSIQPVAAREVLWTYRGVSEELTEKDFFMALEKLVAGEIARRSQTDGRIWVGRELHLRVGSYTVQARMTNIEPLLATLVTETTTLLG